MLIGLWITTGCNLNCKYCYEGSEKHYENMSFEMADKVIEFIHNNYNDEMNIPLIIEFHGGEPLLNYELIPYVILQIEKRLKGTLFGITTNGILLDSKKIQFLAEKMTFGLSLSIDGDKESNDMNRIDCMGKGIYDCIIKKIPELIKYSKTLRARMTYTPDTVKSLSSNIIHLIEMGFTNIVSAPDYFSDGWTKTKMNDLLQEMETIKSYNNENNQKTRNVRISLLEDVFKKKGYCQGGDTNFHILPNGDIYPCSYGVGSRDLLLGNIEEGGIDLEKAYKISTINKLPNPDCKGCTGYTSCVSTRCKIFNKVLAGDFQKPVPIICAIEHVKYKFWYVNNSK